MLSGLQATPLVQLGKWQGYAGFPCFHLPGQPILEFRFFEPHPNQRLKPPLSWLGGELIAFILRTARDFATRQTRNNEAGLGPLVFWFGAVGVGGVEKPAPRSCEGLV